MSTHPLEQLIRAADVAITSEDYDALMDFYADDAKLVVKPACASPARTRSARPSWRSPNAWRTR
jgi:ketosteroid isomerase-like protein